MKLDAHNVFSLAIASRLAIWAATAQGIIECKAAMPLTEGKYMLVVNRGAIEISENPGDNLHFQNGAYFTNRDEAIHESRFLLMQQIQHANMSYLQTNPITQVPSEPVQRSAFSDDLPF